MNDIERRIAIGFMDEMSLENRNLLVHSDIKVRDIVGHDGYDFSVEATDVMRWLESSDENHIWWYGERGYPVFQPLEKRLPFMIFCRGRIPSSSQSRLAVIGTRRCDYPGLQKSFEIGLEATINGYCVVTGLAEGCDRAATQGAIAAGGLVKDPSPAYAVLGHGLQWDDRRFTENLCQSIVESGGAVLSQFAPKANPTRYTFPNRNVILAAMCEAVVAVQAPLKSGTLITVDHAINMGRDVYVSDAGQGDSVCRRGTDRLLFEGAMEYEELSCNWQKLSSGPEQSFKGVRFGSLRYNLCSR